MAPINHRCCKIQQRTSPFLPPRPKRPVTGFNLYIRHFHMNNVPKRHCPIKRKRLERGNLMVAAAKEWCELPQLTRDIYNDTARPDIEKHKVTMLTWTRQRSLLKKPGNPYILFYIDFYNKNGQGNCITDVGRAAGQCWWNLSDIEKHSYERRYRKQQKAHCQMIQQLKDRTATIDDFLSK